jgi:hypothetical protein
MYTKYLCLFWNFLRMEGNFDEEKDPIGKIHDEKNVSLL